MKDQPARTRPISNLVSCPVNSRHKYGWTYATNFWDAILTIDTKVNLLMGDFPKEQS